MKSIHRTSYDITIFIGATGYVNIAVHQDPRLNIIPYDNMKEAIKFMIESFLDANGNQPPSKIIWYRGGASVGSLQTILKNELIGMSSAQKK